MMLSNSSVLSLQDGVLTLRFPREGDVKGFNASGHETILKQVLSSRFSLNVSVKGVAGADGGAAARSGERPGGPAAGGRPAAPARRDPAPAPPEFVPPEFAGLPDEPDDNLPPDDLPPDDLAPDEPSPDDQVVQGSELTGMDLIQRELGGQVIGEFEG
jgi:DNA polymerase III subunit gamma/tau